MQGVRVCGTRGGSNFVDVDRPDMNGNCPDGKVPCSSKTSIENTVCYAEQDLKSKCPITSIDVVSDHDSAGLVGKGYESTNMDGDHVIVFSKDEDSLPITTIKIEN